MSNDTLAAVAFVALMVALLALVLSLWLVLRTRRLARLGSFRPQMPADLQSALEREVERVDGLTLQVQDARDRLPGVERRAAASIQHVGIVRYNPFADTGGQQSFAVAMLDSRGNGFVISSLHSRQATRVYLKQIAGSRSEATLSDEESEAIRRALAGDTNQESTANSG